MLFKYISALSLFFLVNVIVHGQESNVQVTITNIRANDGIISFGVFKDNESFKIEEPWKSIKFSKAKVKDGKLLVSFYLPAGIYGLTILDDENSNGEMEYNWIGIPKEGFGFSDGYWHTGLSKPDISEFDIEVKSDGITKTNVKVKYMLD